MVCDGAVKDQDQETAAASTASAASVVAASEASPAPVVVVVSARPSARSSPHDKRLGVRHPLKHRRFRAGGKMMVEPGGVPPAHAVPEGEEEEEEEEEGASEVEEEELVEAEAEQASSAGTAMRGTEVEVSSAPAAGVQEMEVEVEGGEMEVKYGEMEVSPEPAVAVGGTELEAHPDEEDEVSSISVARGEKKQEAASPPPAASAVLAVEAPREMGQYGERAEKERRDKERERQKERERVDEVGYMSGGWKSVDGTLNCGYSSFRGKRASMEDFYDIKSSKIDDKQINLFGIFDGHGGSRAAEYLKEHLFENLMKHPEFMTNTKLAISETYRKTDSEFLDAERNTHRDDGSTASTAVLVGDHLYVANVGDSRAVISKAGKAIALSEDHKPNRSDERKRIESAGGIVMWAGTWRVGGVLAMSRAFGNRLLKQFVIADPEIQEQEINDELEFLIIASDGLWDVVPNEDAVTLVKMEEEPEAAARKLTETAFSRGSGDKQIDEEDSVSTGLMAAEDCDGLPMYIEEDEEEAAAEKQKRRQQSQKPPFKYSWEIDTPEENARWELRRTMMNKLFEFDPKTGSRSYTQVWFVNLITFNLDDETQYGPMRFTDSLIGGDHMLTDSLNVLCLKIRSSDVGYPINVYGTVIVRDRLDMKCNYIFKRNRNNCQLVESEGESLILTGPTRGIVLSTDAYFEINLKIKQDRESEDRQFCKTLIDVDSARINDTVKTETTSSWLSEVDLMFSYVKKALEGTIEIRILSGSSSFYGRVTVCTTDIPSHILLYDSDVHGANTIGNDRVLKLLRHVVSVSVDQMLIFHIYPRSGDLNPRIFEFTPQIKGADKVEITCGGHRMLVKVTWSILSVKRGSLEASFGCPGTGYYGPDTVPP